MDFFYLFFLLNDKYYKVRLSTHLGQDDGGKMTIRHLTPVIRHLATVKLFLFCLQNAEKLQT